MKKLSNYQRNELASLLTLREKGKSNMKLADARQHLKIQDKWGLLRFPKGFKSWREFKKYALEEIAKNG